MAPERVPIKQILLLVSLILILYSNTLDNGFVWDDICLIETNARVHSLARIRSFFTTGFFDTASAPGEHGDIRYWRPITLLSLALDYAAWGNRPFGYHLSNALVHAFNATLVFLIFRSIAATRRAALAGALIFALHPLQATPVAYISGRTYLLAATFLLLGCAFFLRRLTNAMAGAANSVASALCVTLSLASTELAFAAPVLLLLLAWMARRPFTRHSVEGVGAAILAVIGYVLCRTLFGFPMSGWLSSPAALSAGHLLAVAESLLLYGALLLLPVGLRMERFMNLPTAADPLALCCAAGAALLIAAVLRGLRRGNVAACLFCWSFAALLPASNIIPIYPSIADRQIFLGEHFLYLPLAALSMIAALSWHNASGSRDGPSRVMRVAGVLALVLLGTLTYVHNEYWRDELTFYERTLRRYPGSVRMSMNLGLLYARLGRFDESVALLSRVAERNPLSARAHCNLGSAYLKMGNYDLAARELGEALELDPKFAVARSELAFMAMSQGRTDEAIVHYRAAIGASPYLMDARLNLAVAYFKQERVEEAVRTLREALALDPMSLDARYFLAVILERQGRLDEAREEYRTILDHYPDCEPAAERFNKCTIPNPDNVNNIRDDGRD